MKHIFDTFRLVRRADLDIKKTMKKKRELSGKKIIVLERPGADRLWVETQLECGKLFRLKPEYVRALTENAIADGYLTKQIGVSGEEMLFITSKGMHLTSWLLFIPVGFINEELSIFGPFLSFVTGGLFFGGTAIAARWLWALGQRWLKML